MLTQAPGPDEVRHVDGVVATTPERTIVDSLEAGTQPEQIEIAVQPALERGMTTPRRLRAAAAGRPRRVQKFIDREQAMRWQAHP